MFDLAPGRWRKDRGKEAQPDRDIAGGGQGRSRGSASYILVALTFPPGLPPLGQRHQPGTQSKMLHGPVAESGHTDLEVSFKDLILLSALQTRVAMVTLQGHF